MKTAFSYFGRLLLFIIAFLVLYVGLSFLLSYIPTSDKSAKGNGDRTIYLFSNGVHLDIVVPVDLVPTDLRQQLRPANSTQLLAFGWGDKGFYLDTPTWLSLIHI